MHILLIPAARPFTDFDSLLLERLVVIQHVSPAHLDLISSGLRFDSQLVRSVTSHLISGDFPNVLVSMAATASLSTAPLHGYQVIFSPYTPHKLAFTGAHNYGIAGENTSSILWSYGACMHVKVVHGSIPRDRFLEVPFNTPQTSKVRNF